MKFLFFAFLAATTLPLSAGDPMETQLKEIVEALCARSRPGSQPEQMRATADLIEKQWTELGLSVTRQEVAVDTHHYYNLSVHFGPEAGPRLVVGAHYDTVAESKGADDNASGVAGLLALAKMLSEAKPTLTHSIDLVAFALEEQPYFDSENMGSRVYAKSLKDAGVEVKLMICLEMIGYYSDAPGSQSYPDPSLVQMFGDKGDYISLVGRQAVEGPWIKQMAEIMSVSGKVRIVPFPAPAGMPGINRSDHASFWHFEYPAIMVTDSANYRNQQYHKEGDTPDTLDYVRMAEVIKGIYAFISGS